MDLEIVPALLAERCSRLEDVEPARELVLGFLPLILSDDHAELGMVHERTSSRTK